MNVILKWNKFVESMIATKNAWEAVCKQVMFHKYHWDKLPPEAQKILQIANTRSKFEVAMPRLMDRWRGYGGLERLLIPVEKKEKEKTEDERTEDEEIAA